jgi:taurine dioxygenase
MVAISTSETLSPELGIVLKDFDVHAELSSVECDELRDTIARHRLILIRGTDVSAADQRRLLQVFGNVVDEKENSLFYSLVDNRISPNGEEGDECAYHCDYSFKPKPVAVVSLFGMDIPAECAKTRFVDGIRACKQMPDALRKRLEGKSVLHASDVTTATAESTGRLGVEDLESRNFLGTLHPAILPHPRTGEPILFINQYLCIRIDGVSHAESDALLSDVFAYIYAESNVYEHSWQPRDLLIFDNIALQHMRTKGPLRILRRMIAY